MTESQPPTPQEQLFHDLLEINQAMARGSEKVLDMILHKGARLIGAEHGSIRLRRNIGGRPALVLEAYCGGDPPGDAQPFHELHSGPGVGRA